MRRLALLHPGPGWIVENRGLVKSALLYFDGIAVITSQEELANLVEMDVSLALPLLEQGLLQAIDPESLAKDIDIELLVQQNLLSLIDLKSSLEIQTQTNLWSNASTELDATVVRVFSKDQFVQREMNRSLPGLYNRLGDAEILDVDKSTLLQWHLDPIASALIISVQAQALRHRLRSSGTLLEPMTPDPLVASALALVLGQESDAEEGELFSI